jgi:hypothetical protein
MPITIEEVDIQGLPSISEGKYSIRTLPDIEVPSGKMWTHTGETVVDILKNVSDFEKENPTKGLITHYILKKFIPDLRVTRRVALNYVVEIRDRQTQEVTPPPVATSIDSSSPYYAYYQQGGARKLQKNKTKKVQKKRKQTRRVSKKH